jgi:hypothetical protein
MSIWKYYGSATWTGSGKLDAILKVADRLGTVNSKILEDSVSVLRDAIMEKNKQIDELEKKLMSRRAK